MASAQKSLATPFRIHSVCGSQRLGFTLDLNAFKRDFKCRDFDGFVVHRYKNDAHVLLYASGVFVVSGVACEARASQVAAEMCRILDQYRLSLSEEKDAGLYPYPERRFQIKNVVGAQQLGYKIKLRAFKKDFRCTAERKHHVLHQYSKDIRVSVFRSGSIIICGTISVDKASQVAEEMCRILEGYRRSGVQEVSSAIQQLNIAPEQSKL